jgi:hypothetical protein
MPEPEQWVEISVKIPAWRVGDFYRVISLWMDGAPLGRAEARARGEPTERWDDTKADIEIAARVLRKLTPPAQRLFRVLFANPGVRYEADKLAELANIPNGRYGIAGVLAWPTRYCNEVGRPLPIEMVPQVGGSIYWMKDYVARAFLEVQGTISRDDGRS